MSESAALQELQDLITQLRQELEALARSWNEDHEIDAFISTQCLRTLHTAKGLATMSNLPKTATMIHSLESSITDISRGARAVDNELLTSFLNTQTILLQMVTHGENTTENQKEKPAPQINRQEASIQTKIDYHTFGLKDEEIRQLTAEEKHIIEQTFTKNRPIIKYFVQCLPENIEEQIQEIRKKISQQGTIITMIPTNATNPAYQYAFIFLFTTSLDKKELEHTLPNPESLTWVQQNPVQEPSLIKDESQITPGPTKDNHKISTTHIDFDAIEEQIWNKKTDPVLHVPLSKIDTLINEANKLISCKIKLEKINKKLHATETHDTCNIETLVALESNITSLDKHTKLLQQSILKARLDKAESIEADLRNLITHLAEEHGKKINFILEGRNIQLDKSLLDGLEHPLLHLMKNSADHGIESPETRKQSGKPECGTIKLIFSTSGEKTTIRLEDDGQGLNLNTIRKKAIEKGLIDPVKAAMLTAQELYQFIFIPGFSTKKNGHPNLWARDWNECC